MPEQGSERGRLVPAVHAAREVSPDADHEIGLAAALRGSHSPDALLALFQRFGQENTHFDAMMRRVCLRALVRRCGHGVTIGRFVSLRNPETFDIGDGVFIGDQAILQGRHDGRCVIGRGSWIGPQAFLDARDLIIGEKVGWGPGAKVLGSEHTALPAELPILQTDLEIRPVRVEDWADIGTGAVILPGVTIGRRTIVGAGAVVTRSLPANCRAAGVPARVLD